MIKINILVTGGTGLGKSTFLNKLFKKFKEFKQKKHQVYSRRDTIDLLESQWDDLEDFYRKYDSSVNKEHFVKRFGSWFALDQVGFLLSRGLIDRELTYALMGGYYASWQWQKYESIIRHQREYQNMPELAVWFEYLANEMNKMNEQRGHSTVLRDDPGIYPDKL